MERLASLKEDMLSLTLNQLRTLVFIREKGSPRKAALALGRDQSSIIKQLESLNGYFQEICGETLATQGPRGEDYAFTKTCDLVVSLAKEMLREWDEKFEIRRSEVGQRVVIGATTFTLEVLHEIWDDVLPQLHSSTQLVVEHIRTRDVASKLLDRRVDLVIGGVLAQGDRLFGREDSDFLEWNRENLCFLTNIPRKKMPVDSISLKELPNYPLVISEAGIVTDAVRVWYGEEYKTRLKLPPPCLDVHWAVQLLRLEFVEGLMISTDTVAKSESAADGKLRRLNLGQGFVPLQMITGLHGRKGEREFLERLDPDHPHAIFWKVFAEHASRRRKGPK